MISVRTWTRGAQFRSTSLAAISTNSAHKTILFERIPQNVRSVCWRDVA
jgi:hypothetical protein